MTVASLSVRGGGAVFHPLSCNSKLGKTSIDRSRGGRGRDLRAVAPFVASTRVSIEATCPDSCPFKEAGCYERAGFTGPLTRELDQAARGFTADAVIATETSLIDSAFHGGQVPQDGARGGRDLRLHVGGDVSSARGAKMLARAASRWRARGGGSVWTFTARWRTIGRESWGEHISVLASVQSVGAAQAAIERGYRPALVVRQLVNERAFEAGGIKLIPCPAETLGKTCVECRLCVDGKLPPKTGIAFGLHGRAAARVKTRLPVLRTTVTVVG
jgi:hypothetical protein